MDICLLSVTCLIQNFDGSKTFSVLQYWHLVAELCTCSVRNGRATDCNRQSDKQEHLRIHYRLTMNRIIEGSLCHCRWCWSLLWFWLWKGFAGGYRCLLEAVQQDTETGGNIQLHKTGFHRLGKRKLYLQVTPGVINRCLDLINGLHFYHVFQVYQLLKVLTTLVTLAHSHIHALVAEEPAH